MSLIRRSSSATSTNGYGLEPKAPGLRLACCQQASLIEKNLTAMVAVISQPAIAVNCKMEGQIEMTEIGNGKSTIQRVGSGPEWDEELRLWLVGHIERNPHLTTVVLSRKEAGYIGASKPQLDAYVKGIYFLPKENGGMGINPKGSNIETLVRNYRETVEGTVRHGYANSFIKTKTWHQLRLACSTAIEEKVIVVVYGKPGVGKSRCLMEYSTVELKSTRPILILCSTIITTRYFVQKLAQALGLDDRPATARLEDMVAEKLKRSPRPIFIDQANYLNEKALGSICYIWDVARVPFVLVGTAELFNLFNTSRLTQDVREQLSSRVAMHYPLSELTQTEITAILKQALGEDATDEVITAIINGSKRIHRHVDMAIPRINQLKKRHEARLASGEMTMLDVVNIAMRRLMTA